MYLEKPLHGKKVTAWVAMRSAGIIKLFFFEDESGDVATVNRDHYLRLLWTKFLPALRRKCNNNIGGLWYQQDGATPHTARHVLAVLEQTFGEQFISFRTVREWLPHSPEPPRFLSMGLFERQNLHFTS